MNTATETRNTAASIRIARYIAEDALESNLPFFRTESSALIRARAEFNAGVHPYASGGFDSKAATDTIARVFRAVGIVS